MKTRRYSFFLLINIMFATLFLVCGCGGGGGGSSTVAGPGGTPVYDIPPYFEIEGQIWDGAIKNSAPGVLRASDVGNSGEYSLEVLDGSDTNIETGETIVKGTTFKALFVIGNKNSFPSIILRDKKSGLIILRNFTGRLPSRDEIPPGTKIIKIKGLTLDPVSTARSLLLSEKKTLPEISLVSVSMEEVKTGGGIVTIDITGKKTQFEAAADTNFLGGSESVKKLAEIVKTVMTVAVNENKAGAANHNIKTGTATELIISFQSITASEKSEIKKILADNSLAQSVSFFGTVVGSSSSGASGVVTLITDKRSDKVPPVISSFSLETDGSAGLYSLKFKTSEKLYRPPEVKIYGRAAAVTEINSDNYYASAQYAEGDTNPVSIDINEMYDLAGNRGSRFTAGINAKMPQPAAKTVETPTAAPIAGTYTGTVEVVLSCATPEAAVRYTTDGSRPSKTAGSVYNSPITIYKDTIIKAAAFKTGMKDSAVFTAGYSINRILLKAERPFFSPAPGTYDSKVAVNMSSTTPNAVIRYTTDGSEPSKTNGTLYTIPVVVSSKILIKAAAYSEDNSLSDISAAEYNITQKTVTAAPVISGSILNNGLVTVTITCADARAIIYYTTDGSEPSETGSTIYSTPFLLSGTATVKAMAQSPDSDISQTASASFSIKAEIASRPVFSPPAGKYKMPVSVTITAADAGVSINYTTDGTIPSENNGTRYSAPFAISSDTKIKAVAFGEKYLISELSEASYQKDTTPVFIPGDTEKPKFTISYYKDAALTIPAGTSPRLGPGNWYLAIKADEKLKAPPVVTINSEGTANDLSGVTAVTGPGGSYVIARTITADLSSAGDTPETVLISAKDEADNSADNDLAANNSEAAFIDTVKPAPPEFSSPAIQANLENLDNSAETINGALAANMSKFAVGCANQTPGNSSGKLFLRLSDNGAAHTATNSGISVNADAPASNIGGFMNGALTGFNDGDIMIEAWIADTAGNSSDTVSVTLPNCLDRTIPGPLSLSIFSSGLNASRAKTGDTVKVRFTPAETLLADPEISISGIDCAVTASGGIYEASHVMAAEDDEGTVVFSASYADTAGNTAVTASATNGSSVIYDKTPPAVSESAIIYPAAGESVRGGAAYNIAWNLSLINDNFGLATLPVALHYSADNGASWSVIAVSEENDGSYDWTVPSIDSSSALIKLTIEDISSNKTAVISEAAFTIDSTKPRPSTAFVGPGNQFIELTFTEPVFGPSSSAPSAGSFSAIYEQNSGVSSTVTIQSVKTADDSNPSGGESVLRIYFSLSDKPSGVEKIKIGPSGAASLYDAAGNAMNASEFTASFALHDTRPPEVISISLSADLTYFDVSFSEGVYGPATTPVTLAGLQMVFSQNSGNATAASMTWLKRPDGSSLTGGESIIRAGLSVTGGPSGAESIVLKPASASSLFDSKGNAAAASYASNPIYLSDNDAPPAPSSIAITPIDGTVVSNTLNSTNTNLVVTASITAGTATGGKARLYLDGRQIATDENILSTDNIISFDLAATTNGSLAALIPSGGVLSAELIDASGNGALSVVGNPSLTVDYTRPSASIAYSPAGTVKAGTVLNITAVTSEPLASASLPKISLSGGNVLTPQSMTKADDTHFSFSHTVSSGDGTASVTLSNAADAAGNPIESLPLSGSGFLVDNTPPSAQITYFPDTPLRTGASVTITAVTSEPLAAAPPLKIEISGANSVAAVSMTKTDDTHYTYIHTVTAGNGTASVTLSNAADLVGNAITAAPVSGSGFAVDNTAPNAYISYSPVNKAKSGAALTITAIFNEPVSDLFTPTITATGTEAFASASMTRVDPTHYTYLHTVSSAGNGTSSVTLAGAKDLAGNAVTATPTAGNQFFIDNIVPTASIYYSSPGPYISGKNITITAVFSEATAASPVPVISISGANTLAPTAMTMTDTTHYTLAYTVAAGNGAASIAFSAGTDIAGNALQSTPFSGGSFTIDNSPLTISFSSISSDNSYIDLGFSEGIFGAADGETPALDQSFDLIFSDNGGGATDAELVSITQTDGSPLSGGETTVRFNLNITGTPTGDETIEIKPSAAAALFDQAGNEFSASQTTGQKFLNNMTLPTISGVTYSVNPPKFKLGTLITITADFSAAVAAAPVPKISISGASSVTNASMTLVNATRYKYGYSVGAGNGESSISIAADPSVPPAPFNPAPVSGGTFTVDNTPPKFSVSGYQVNAAGDVIQIIFDEDMTSPTAITTKSNWTFYYADNNAGLNLAAIVTTNATLAYSAPSRTLTLTLNEATDNAYIPLGKYLRAVSHATNIKDVAGNSTGALSIYSQAATPVESLPPTFTISGTSNNNAGDTIVLTFSDSMYNGGNAMTSKANWSIHLASDAAGTNLFPVIIANATLAYSQTTRKLTITLHEGTDKSFIQNNKFIRAIPHPANIKDLAGNAIGSFSAYSAAAVPKETVSPSVSSVTAASSNNANDTVYINFNDYMDTTPAVLNNKLNWKIEYADDAAGTNAQTLPLTNAAVAFDFTSTRKRINVTLNEATNGAYIPAGKFLIVTPLSSAPTDLAGNPLALTPKASAAVITTETTKPVISSVTATSAHNGGDQVNINFSELMNTTQWPILDRASWQLEYADDSIGTNIQPLPITNAVLSFVPASKKVMFTLNEQTDNSFIPASKFIKATILVPGNVRDLVGNQCTTVSKISAAITKETTRPLIFSMTLGGGDGQINNGDSMVITFTEPINPASINAGLAKGGSVTINSAVTGQVTWPTTSKIITVSGICSFSVNKTVNFTTARLNTSQTTLALDAAGKTLTVTLDDGVTPEAVLAYTALQSISASTGTVKDLVGNFLNSTATYKIAIGQRF